MVEVISANVWNKRRTDPQPLIEIQLAIVGKNDDTLLCFLDVCLPCFPFRVNLPSQDHFGPTCR